MEVKNASTYLYAPTVVVEDEEAHRRVEFGPKRTILAYIYPAGGQVQAEMHGKELPYILNLLTNTNVLKEGYGIAVEGAEIDYRVISIKRYTHHYLCEIKKL